MGSSSELSELGEGDYRTELGSVDADTLSVAIVRGIAAVRGVSPVDLDIRLHDYLDVDAVEGLYRSGGQTDWQLDVEVEDNTVVLRSDGALVVY